MAGFHRVAIPHESGGIDSLDVGLAQFAGEFIEHLQEARHEEVAERALAVVVHLAILHGDEDDALEEAGRAAWRCRRAAALRCRAPGPLAHRPDGKRKVGETAQGEAAVDRDIIRNHARRVDRADDAAVDVDWSKAKRSLGSPVVAFTVSCASGYGRSRLSIAKGFAGVPGCLLS